MNDDTISRAAAIEALKEAFNPSITKFVQAKLAIENLPPAQQDIKQAAKLLSDFIGSCPGGDSYLITPDGEKLRTDWGYVTEGIQLIHDWAERKSDE